jgi:hypothetical protein
MLPRQTFWNWRPGWSFRPLDPLIRSDSPDEFEFAIAERLEDCGFSFTRIHEIFTPCIYQVRFMADDHRVFAGCRWGPQQLPKSLRATVILIGRNHQASLGNIGGSRDFGHAE